MNPSPPTTSSPLVRRAFTLLEVIVVIAVLAVLATMIVPQLKGNDRREFRHAVDQVADLLTMYAQRQSLGEKVVGIGHDRSQNWLTLMVIDTDNISGVTGAWRMDRYVDPVKFPNFMTANDVAIVADGDHYDASQWPLSSEIGKDRPVIEISLRGAGESAVVTLQPYGVSPVVAASFGGTGVIRTRMNLDTGGHSREDW
jgi:prepilin-type N-terminal cleavage/methylation domain-containing protein